MKEKGLDTWKKKKKKKRQLNKRKATNKTMKRWLLKSAVPLLQQQRFRRNTCLYYQNTHFSWPCRYENEERTGWLPLRISQTKEMWEDETSVHRSHLPRVGEKKLLHLSSKSHPAHIDKSQWLSSPLCMRTREAEKKKKSAGIVCPHIS